MPDEIEKRDGRCVSSAARIKPVTIGAIEKMSKSKKNVVDPEAIIDAYRRRHVRWFVLSDTPPERDIEWTQAASKAAGVSFSASIAW